jgi:hypothetical protein
MRRRISRYSFHKAFYGLQCVALPVPTFVILFLSRLSGTLVVLQCDDDKTRISSSLTNTKTMQQNGEATTNKTKRNKNELYSVFE